MKIYSKQAGYLGTNCYMITTDDGKEAAIVDPADFVPEYAEKIKELGSELKYLILTHGHGDHTGGVTGFKNEFPDVKLAAGRKEEDLLANSSANFSAETTGRSVCLTPDVWLNDGDELKLGSITLRVIETPGHTAGGISVLADNEALFSGDTLFRESIGRTDLPTGDYETLISSIKEKLFTLDNDVRVLPGHMGSSTIGFEKINNPYLV